MSVSIISFGNQHYKKDITEIHYSHKIQLDFATIARESGRVGFYSLLNQNNLQILISCATEPVN
jgi:hypothetical protein